MKTQWQDVSEILQTNSPTKTVKQSIGLNSNVYRKCQHIFFMPLVVFRLSVLEKGKYGRDYIVKLAEKLAAIEIPRKSYLYHIFCCLELSYLARSPPYPLALYKGVIFIGIIEFSV